MFKKTLLTSAVGLLLFGAATAYAQNCGIMPQCVCAGTPCKICDLFQLIKNIIGWVILVLVPLAAVLVITIAGFKMMLNQDNSEVWDQCKQIILSTVIGLVIVYGGYALVGFILSSMGYAAMRGLDWAPTCQY